MCLIIPGQEILENPDIEILKYLPGSVAEYIPLQGKEKHAKDKKDPKRSEIEKRNIFNTNIDPRFLTILEDRLQKEEFRNQINSEHFANLAKRVFTGFIQKIAVNIGQKEKDFYLQIAHKDHELFTTGGNQKIIF